MKSRAASAPTRYPGFTLVELLVTITIIAVLPALGFMGSSNFLKRAGAVKDVANMKTIWSGITLYAADHNDMLPGSPTSGLFSGQKAGWLKEVPEKMTHGSYRLAMYFDGSSGKLNQKNKPN